LTAEVLAHAVLERCAVLARYSEEPGRLTRRPLTAAYRAALEQLASWATAGGLLCRIDHAGNVLAELPPALPGGPTLVIGSHLDTVPDAGQYDGVLGVLIGLALAGTARERGYRYGIQVVGFTDEEGVRFGTPLFGSRCYIGDFDPAWLERRDRDGITLRSALHDFGLDPTRLAGQRSVPERAIGYLEFHIEQGPVLDEEGIPLGVVTGIAGSTRATVRFAGRAGHAGTVPMPARRDALCGAAEFVLAVEARARATAGLVGTIGRLEVDPGASNVIPGRVACSLDVRHLDDGERRAAVAALRIQAEEIARARGLTLEWELVAEQGALRLENRLRDLLEQAVARAGYPVFPLASGAGHDALVVARAMPAAMLFIRCAGGVSHHPDERVALEDIVAALRAGQAFLDLLEREVDDHV